MPTPRIDIGRALAHGLDPALFCERLEFAPDPWQQRFLRSDAAQVIINCGRQVGKSTVVAARAVHGALYRPGSLCLLVAPSLRQSRELALKVTGFLDRLEPTPALEENNKLSVTLANGSRIVALPGDNSKTVRGYSAPDLVIEDEAAFCSDETHAAIVPMLAASPRGRLVLLSTPNSTAGHFYEIWHGGGDWERYTIPTRDCPRVRPEWLAQRRREDPLNFAREYECEFGSAEDSLFPDVLLAALEADNFEPFDVGLAA